MRPGLFTQSALAVELGLDRRTVAHRLRQVPPRGKVRGHDGWHIADVIGTAPAVADTAGMTVEEAKRRKLAAEAAMAEIALEKQQGTVVELALVMDEIGNGLSNVRARLLGLGGRIAPIVAMESDPGACKTIVDDVVHEALEELSSGRFSPENPDAGNRPS